MGKAIGMILLIGILVYGLSLGNGFAADDEALITNNVAVYSLANVGKFFEGGSFYSGGAAKLGGIYYKPIPLMVFAAVASVFGINASAFHFVQLGLHIVDAVLLVYLFKRFLNFRMAVLLAVIFLVHPINVESVAYISAMQEPLFTFFGLLGLLVLSGKSGRSGMLGMGLLLLSLLTKEAGMLFVLIYFFYLVLFRIEKLRMGVLGVLGALGIYGIMRFGVAGVFFNHEAIAPIMRADLATRLLNIPRIISSYFSTFLFPGNLIFSQNWVVKNISPGDLWGVGVLIGLIGIIWKIGDKKKYLFFLGWFLIGLGLHLQIIPLDGTVADRWMYFPLIGLLGMGGVLVERIRVRDVRVVGVVGGLILMVLAGRSLARTLDWTDNLTLFTHDEALDKTSFVLENSLGSELTKIGKYDEAKIHFENSINLYPSYINWNNLGSLYVKTGEYDQAQKSFLEAIKIGDYYLPYENIAGVYLVKNENEKVVSYAEEAMKKFPGNQKLWLFWAIAKYRLGDKEAALRGARIAAVINPSPEANYVLQSIINGDDVVLKN